MIHIYTFLFRSFRWTETAWVCQAVLLLSEEGTPQNHFKLFVLKMAQVKVIIWL